MSCSLIDKVFRCQVSEIKNPGLNLRNGVFVCLNHGFLPLAYE